jgi:hypothetical protein
MRKTQIWEHIFLHSAEVAFEEDCYEHDGNRAVHESGISELTTSTVIGEELTIGALEFLVAPRMPEETSRDCTQIDARLLSATNAAGHVLLGAAGRPA